MLIKIHSLLYLCLPIQPVKIAYKGGFSLPVSQSFSYVERNDPDDNGMSIFYVNKFNAGQLPSGEYEISFLALTDDASICHSQIRFPIEDRSLSELWPQNQYL
jgi:hypothetical protein